MKITKREEQRYKLDLETSIISFKVDKIGRRQIGENYLGKLIKKTTNRNKRNRRRSKNRRKCMYTEFQK